MSSGVQKFRPRVTDEVEAVRYDGTNRSLIEQWIEARKPEITIKRPAVDWIEGSWCTLGGAALRWFSNVDFIAAFEPVPPA